MENTEITKTNRQLVADILGAVHPESDLSDEETLFGIIYNDYEEYARVIEEREKDIKAAEEAAELRGRNAAIEESLITRPVGDGVPALSGANIQASHKPASIFDIALMRQ